MNDLIHEKKADIETLVSPSIKAAGGAPHGFFTRTGGVSFGEFESMNFRHTGDSPENIRKNCERSAAVLGRKYEDIVRTKQQHTDEIAVISDWQPGIRVAYNGERASDGLMTNVPNVCLMGFFADCQLIFFYDPKNKAIAAVHSGWRGTAQQIAEKTITLMHKTYGTSPADLRVAISPAICQDCFETDRDVYNALMTTFGRDAQRFCAKKGCKFHFDTKAMNIWRLKEAGVLEENIDASEECTCCGDEKLFWSHRRQGLTRGVHAGMITLE